MNRYVAPEGTSFNNHHFAAWAVFPIEDGDTGQRVRLPDVADRILESDLDETHQWGHIAGLMAARVTQFYLEGEYIPIYEKSLDLGTLAMMGCFITGDQRLEEIEIDLAGAYQRQILFTGVLEDGIKGIAAYSRMRPNFASVASLMAEYIETKRFWYPQGRRHFSETFDIMVDKYQGFIRNTPPLEEEIGAFRHSPGRSPHLIQRFLQLRCSLQAYVPTLRALEEPSWQALRQEYAKVKHLNRLRRNSTMNSKTSPKAA